MPLWCLTKEKVEELLKQRDLKVFVLQEVQGPSGKVSYLTTWLCCCAERRTERAPEEIPRRSLEGGPGGVCGGAGGTSAAGS